MRFVLRMAVRETRASWRRLLFFFVCIAIGVAAMFLLPETAPVKTGRREAGPDPVTAASVDLR